ncbi:MAG: trimethylamine methyltransferase family protein [Candidatus Omnitrophica bacterium]|nr:trimethylamine methyltransferase family protein [Candidatus Omnitrophota bacterium]
MKILLKSGIKLDRELIRKMHSSALNLLEKIGIEVKENKIIDRIKKKKGIKIEKDRVKISPSYIESLLEEYLKNNRSKKETLGNEEIVGYTCSHAYYYHPPFSENLVPFKTEDLIFSTKIIDSLWKRKIKGACPGIPTDVHPYLQPLLQFKISALYSRFKPCHVGYGSLDTVKFLEEMYKIMNLNFSIGIHMISPFKMCGDEFKIALEYLDREDVSFSISSMPMAGISSPFSLIGTYIQAISEILGGFAILKTYNESIKVELSPISGYIFDMKYGNMVYGTPEHLLSDFLRKEISEFYGMKNITTRSLRSMAKFPGVQSCIEKSMGACFGFFINSTSFNGVGSLSLDEIFSPEQAIIDCEIIDYVRRLKKGIDYNEEDLNGEVIFQGVKEGDFILLEDTINKYKNEYWYPIIFDYMLTQQFLKNPISYKKKISEEIEKCIKEYDFEIEKSKRIEIEKIWEKAKEKILSEPRPP